MSKGNGKFDPSSVLDFPDLKEPMRQLGRVPWVLVLVGLLLLIGVLTSFYTIDPEEEGVVLRFGKFSRTTEPGLHTKIPFGIEKVYKVPVERQEKHEYGFRTVRSATRTQYSDRDYSHESLMFTGDLNLAEVEWAVQYRIVEPKKYLFRVRNVEATFRAMTESLMREVVGDRTINEVITFGRQELASEVERDLQALCDQYQTGIKVEQVVLQNVNPPDPVRPSFNDVNQAEQEKDQKIKAAQEEYNKVIPKARGEAEQVISQAEGYALDRINRSRGDAARFVALYQTYRLAPEVTRKRMYLETMAKILPRTGRTVVVDEEVTGMLPLLNLDGTIPSVTQSREGGQ